MSGNSASNVSADSHVSAGHRFDADHPALPGHFPGHPVVPAVLTLETVIAAAHRQWPALAIGGVRKAKFLHPLAPAEEFAVHFGAPRADSLRFRCVRGGQVFVEGNLSLDVAVSPAA